MDLNVCTFFFLLPLTQHLQGMKSHEAPSKGRFDIEPPLHSEPGIMYLPSWYLNALVFQPLFLQPHHQSRIPVSSGNGKGKEKSYRSAIAREREKKVKRKKRANLQAILTSKADRMEVTGHQNIRKRIRFDLAQASDSSFVHTILHF
ncbi:hypothetical protein BDZ91DRAFT_718506 [Kalaharituber pfeilii]|nr:hypothetical protein BDZ91DRAFT_718506 [Kalaharituber pfeilii]